MDINLTLLGEMITFMVLVLVTVKYIWPQLLNLISERQQKIAAGLAAAEKGQSELKAAKVITVNELKAAKSKAMMLMDQAQQRANSLLEESRTQAKLEQNKILTQAKLELKQEIKKTETALRRQSVELIVAATKKILQQEVNEISQRKLIENLLSKV